MNKAELVEAVAQHYDGSRAAASHALDAVLQTITRSTVAGERVAITGFGIFEKVERPARMVRNPRTGERKEAPATSVPRFRAGTELKAYVAGSRELPAGPAEGAAAPAARTPRTRRAVAVDVAPPPAEEPSAKVKPTKTVSKKTPATKASTEKSEGKKASAKKGDSKKSDSKKSDSKKSSKKSGKKS